jgi:uncharacterized glyoxalase superfamily protein PhnB
MRHPLSTPVSGWTYMVVHDVDRHHEQATAAGAAILAQPHDYGPGFRGYSARDLEGYLWSFTTQTPNPAIATRRRSTHARQPGKTIQTTDRPG